MTTDDPHARSIPVAVIKQLQDEHSGQPLTTITVTDPQKTKYKRDKSRFALLDKTPRKISDPIMVGVYCWTYDQVITAAKGEQHSVRRLTKTESDDELPSLTLSAQRRAELTAAGTTTVSVTHRQLAEIKLRKNSNGPFDGRNLGRSSPELFELMRRAFTWFTDPNALSDYKLPA